MKYALSLAALVFASTAVGHAADKNSAKAVLTGPAQVGQTTLPAGEYSLHWAENAGVVTLSIAGGKSRMAVPVTVDPSKAGREAVLLHTDGGKTVVDGFTTKEGLLTVKAPASDQPASASK